MRTFLLMWGLFLITSCGDHPATDQPPESNPAAPGFDLAGSDSTAIAIADSVMVAMGGRNTWDKTRYLEWTFFGLRHLIWDKKEGRVRIDEERDSLTYLINIRDESGRIFSGDQELVEPELRDSLIERGQWIWINDSYWLAMPFKLKDSGVTLKHLGADTTASGQKAEVLQLTFNEVGVTPDNKYLVYVDPSNYLVREWAYFRNFTQDTANLRTPWLEYQERGGLLFSAEREIGRLEDIEVWDSMPDSIFTAPSASTWHQ